MFTLRELITAFTETYHPVKSVNCSVPKYIQKQLQKPGTPDNGVKVESLHIT